VQVKENADILPVVAMKDNVKFTERKTLVFDRLGTAASSESAKKKPAKKWEKGSDFQFGLKNGGQRT